MSYLKFTGFIVLGVLPLILSGLFTSESAKADVSTFLFGNHPKKCEKLNPNGPDFKLRPDLTVKNTEFNPAFEYVECLAKNRDRMGSYWLGMFYLNGNGVEQNYKKAAKHLKRAARPDSGTESVYIPGIGGSSGYAMSFQARQRTDGLSDAKYQMALLHNEGLGVKKKEKHVRQYLTLAARQGHQKASEMLQELYPEAYEDLMNE